MFLRQTDRQTQRQEVRQKYSKTVQPNPPYLSGCTTNTGSEFDIFLFNSCMLQSSSNVSCRLLMSGVVCEYSYGVRTRQQQRNRSLHDYSPTDADVETTVTQMFYSITNIPRMSRSQTPELFYSQSGSRGKGCT